jgi:type I restriction enzyme M protein
VCSSDLLFGHFEESTRDGVPISRIFKNEDFGYRTITVERPQRDAKGKVLLGTKGKGKGKPMPDAALRDTENVPLSEDVDTYFKREVLPHAPDAWIDHGKTKVGYEIPFNRHFYGPNVTSKATTCGFSGNKAAVLQVSRKQTFVQ